MSELFPVRFLFHSLSRHCFGALAAPGACEASALPSAPFRFWLPRAGSPRKAASGLGSRAHSLPGARDRRAEQEKRMYLNRITLIGFLGGDAEKKVSNWTNIALFSLATKTSWKNDAGTWESRTEWHRCVAFGRLAESPAASLKVLTSPSRASCAVMNTSGKSLSPITRRPSRSESGKFVWTPSSNSTAPLNGNRLATA